VLVVSAALVFNVVLLLLLLAYGRNNSRYHYYDQPASMAEGSEGSEGSTAKEGTSTVNLSAEDNGSTMNSGKADAQNWHKAVHPDANFTQKKAADTAVDPLKPSEPSGSSGLSFSFLF